MKKVLDETGILFISDEVQTAWGRTGEHFWGYEAHDVTPDLLTFAKGLGNGLSMAGVIARADIMDCLQAQSISTFGGNPLVCAGSLANLRYLLDHDLQANALVMGHRILDRLTPLAGRLDVVGEVRGKGLMIGVELVGSDGRTPDAAAANEVLERCKAAGLLVGKGGLFGNCIRIAPPMSITADEVDEGTEIVVDALTAVDDGAGA
jgi:4-aminobutyrate aminotransferase